MIISITIDKFTAANVCTTAWNIRVMLDDAMKAYTDKSIIGHQSLLQYMSIIALHQKLVNRLSVMKSKTKGKKYVIQLMPVEYLCFKTMLKNIHELGVETPVIDQHSCNLFIEACEESWLRNSLKFLKLHNTAEANNYMKTV